MTFEEIMKNQDLFSQSELALAQQQRRKEIKRKLRRGEDLTKLEEEYLGYENPDILKKKLIEKLGGTVSALSLLGLVVICIILGVYKVDKTPAFWIVMGWLLLSGIIQGILVVIKSIVAPHRYYPSGTSRTSSYYFGDY